MPKNNTTPDPIALKMLRLLFRIFTPLFPKLMGKLAYHLWFTPPKTKMPDIEKAYAKSAKSWFITVDGLKILVRSWGEGPTVLFIHGWGGRGTQVSSFIDKLNHLGFNVMSFDLPAHGRSEGKQTNAFSIANVTQEIINNISNLHTVMTHSFGGVIYGYCYTSLPTLKNIVMFCPPSTLNVAFKQFSEALELTPSIKVYLEQQLTLNFGDDIFEKLSLIKNVQKIAQPVLVVHDKEDDVVPFQEGKEVAQAIEHCTFYETNELGHRKVLFDKNVVEFVLTFLQK